MKRRGLAPLIGAAAASLWLGAAQSAPTPTASPARKVPGIPRTRDGKPDFSGIWQTTSAADYDLEPHGPRRDAPPGPGVVEGGFIPYLPAALEQKKKNFEQRETLDPRARGYQLGAPRGIYHRAPVQIFQRPRDVTVFHQFGHSVRTIHTNGTPHPTGERQEHWLGDSRGRFEGDTLVVSTQDFNGETWLDRAGNWHSTELKVVERFRHLDPHTLAYSATLEDPKVYSRPWTLNVVLYRHREPNFQLVEDYRFTLEYEQYYPPRQ